MLRRISASLATLLLLATFAFAQAPELSDPGNRLIDGFDAPGTYPSTVTATNVNVMPSPGSEIDGANEDVFRAEFPASGPIPWTSPRMNAGDIALSIGPAFPDNPLSYPSGDAGFQNNFQAMQGGTDPIDPATTDLTTLAWRTSTATGAHLATTRHNGIDGGYVLPNGGGPVGSILGISYFSAGSGRQGFGFSMDTGAFANEDATNSELHLGHGGAANGASEAVFNFAAAYFPYEEGWKGAWVAPSQSGEASFKGSSDMVEPSEVFVDGGLGFVDLADINSATDGMLFVAPASGSSTSRIASAFPNMDGGWTTTIRLDADDDVTGQTIEEFEEFQFLYVPYDANRLVGGHVDGTDGSTINAAGDEQFSLARSESGRYALSVFEADGTTKKNDDSGMLILSVADTHPDDPEIGSRAFMSYEYDSESGDFIIESRELISQDSAMPFDGFGNEFAGSDSDFYFAWVDFHCPMNLSEFLPADFDESGAVDVDDFLTLSRSFGESVTPGTSADIDCDGAVTTRDFLALSRSFGQRSGGTEMAAVPEPSTLPLFAFATVFVGLSRRKRRV